MNGEYDIHSLIILALCFNIYPPPPDANSQYNISNISLKDTQFGQQIPSTLSMCVCDIHMCTLKRRMWLFFVDDVERLMADFDEKSTSRDR